MHKYVDQKGSAAMLTIKRSAVVAPPANLRDPLHAGDEAQKPGITDFKIHGRNYQQCKTGVSVAQQKGLMSSKI